ncbi:MAG: hypothetical protein QW633_02915, partial [Candidatus Aenigmatarchaeota archaeon]
MKSITSQAELLFSIISLAFIVSIIATATNITSEVETTKVITVFTDKASYSQNETIKIFGEAIIADEEINLSIEFNESLVYSTKINLINNSYSHSLIANFEQEGLYLVKVFSGNLESSTSFYYNLPPKLVLFGSNATKIKVGDVVEFYALWHDISGLKDYTFSWNASGKWEEERYEFSSKKYVIASLSAFLLLALIGNIYLIKKNLNTKYEE